MKAHVGSKVCKDCLTARHRNDHFTMNSESAVVHLKGPWCTFFLTCPLNYLFSPLNSQ